MRRLACPQNRCRKTLQHAAPEPQPRRRFSGKEKEIRMRRRHAPPAAAKKQKTAAAGPHHGFLVTLAITAQKQAAIKKTAEYTLRIFPESLTPGKIAWRQT